MSTVGEHVAKSPLDLSKLDNITDPAAFQSEMHKMIRENLQSGGFIPPTDGLTTPALTDGEDTGSFFKNLTNKVTTTLGSKAFDTPSNNYEQSRFNFIAGEEGFSAKAYKDSLKLITIGYGFNLSDKGNFAMAARVLNKTPAQMLSLRNGTTNISNTEARTLFESSAANAESIINNTFKDVPLNSGQRLSLVSLAYNHPALIGPKLTKAIKGGDFEAADHEIRSNSNKYGIKGIQNRRGREADMFSSFSKDKKEHGGAVADFLGLGGASKPKVAEAPKPTAPVVDPIMAQEIKTRAAAPSLGGMEMLDSAGNTVASNESIMSMVPAHIRMFAQDMFGSQEGNNGQIKTSDFFSKSELTGILSVVGRAFKRNGGKSKGVVEYGDDNNPKDYATGVTDVSFASNDLSLVNAAPEAIIKKTLGQFNWEVNKDGDLIVTDQYNFNDAEKMRKQYPSQMSKLIHLTALAGKAADPESDTGLYGVVRRAAAFYGSKEGEGVHFSINLGKVDLKQMVKQKSK
jgi:GH24 family phage-related lysozyme (muramidase)